MGSSTTIEPSQPSPEERQLQLRQLELAEFQLEALRKQFALQEGFAEELGPLFEILAADAERARERALKQEPIQDELNQLALEDLRRGGAASPEQIKLIEDAGSAAVERGGVDIERFRTESLEALREELAPSLGLRPTDTPILDRGAKVAAEATRQGGPSMLASSAGIQIGGVRSAVS